MRGALLAHSKRSRYGGRSGHRRGQANTLLSMAAIQEDSGDRDKVLDSLNRAAGLLDEVGATDQATDTPKRIDALRQKLEPLSD